MTLTASQFFRILEDEELIDSARLRALTESECSSEADASRLAAQLVREQHLSPYQAKLLLDGGAKSLIFGDYVVLEELGAGGMGKVLKARHRRMQRVVALKVVRRAALDSPEAIRRFQREVQVLASLNHPNIVIAYDSREQAGEHYLVMEFVDGSDLAKLVRKRGPMPVPQAVACILQAARGLEHAHSQQIVHRDVKPANLILDNYGLIKVLDLGLARFETSLAAEGDGWQTEGLSVSGHLMGTADYMSPEQSLNAKRSDHRCDIYSLGCTLFYLLTGRPVYAGETLIEKVIAHRESAIPSLSARRPDVPECLSRIFERMIAKHPDDRFQSMSELHRTLEACCPQAGKSLHETIQVPEPEAAVAAKATFKSSIGRGSEAPTFRSSKSGGEETFAGRVSGDTEASTVLSLPQSGSTQGRSLPRQTLRPRWLIMVVAVGGLGLISAALVLNSGRWHLPPLAPPATETRDQPEGETGRDQAPNAK
jgi:serine/threonine protein kinase